MSNDPAPCAEERVVLLASIDAATPGTITPRLSSGELRRALTPALSRYSGRGGRSGRDGRRYIGRLARRIEKAIALVREWGWWVLFLGGRQAAWQCAAFGAAIGRGAEVVRTFRAKPRC